MSTTLTRPTYFNNELSSNDSRTNGSRRAAPRLAHVLAVVGLLACSSTSFGRAVDGEILSPEDGETIHYSPDFTVPFYGYTYSSGATIEIQTRNTRGYWVTIATTTASSSANHGVYFWSTSVMIPSICWQQSDYNWLDEAEVRAVRVSGRYQILLGDSIIIQIANGNQGS